MVELLLDPPGRRGGGELAHENVPVVEVRVSAAVRVACVVLGVRLIASSACSTRPSASPGRLFLLR